MTRRLAPVGRIVRARATEVGQVARLERLIDAPVPAEDHWVADRGVGSDGILVGCAARRRAEVGGAVGVAGYSPHLIGSEITIRVRGGRRCVGVVDRIADFGRKNNK